MQIAVVGGGECRPEVSEMACLLGRLLAEKGHVLICGGLGGVMEAACRGAKKAGGLTLGILPGEMGSANEFVDIAIATGMGHARNAIIAKSADAVIALPGELGYPRHDKGEKSRGGYKALGLGFAEIFGGIMLEKVVIFE